LMAHRGAPVDDNDRLSMRTNAAARRCAGVRVTEYG
jgi:hypothetical protein